MQRRRPVCCTIASVSSATRCWPSQWRQRGRPQRRSPTTPRDLTGAIVGSGCSRDDSVDEIPRWVHPGGDRGRRRLGCDEGLVTARPEMLLRDRRDRASSGRLGLCLRAQRTRRRSPAPCRWWSRYVRFDHGHPARGQTGRGGVHGAEQADTEILNPIGLARSCALGDSNIEVPVSVTRGEPDGFDPLTLGSLPIERYQSEARASRDRPRGQRRGAACRRSVADTG